MEIETLVLLAYAIEDSTDIFRIWGGGGGLNTPNPPSRYATVLKGPNTTCKKLKTNRTDSAQDNGAYLMDFMLGT